MEKTINTRKETTNLRICNNAFLYYRVREQSLWNTRKTKNTFSWDILPASDIWRFCYVNELMPNKINCSVTYFRSLFLIALSKLVMKGSHVAFIICDWLFYAVAMNILYGCLFNQSLRCSINLSNLLRKNNFHMDVLTWF